MTIHRVSGRVMLCLSCLAFVTVLTGFTGPLPKDEGTGAHIFQLSIVALLPAMLVFIATADWSQPGRRLRPLALAALIVVLAFTALYYLEHR